MPPTRKLQIIYACLVGIIFGAQYKIGPLYSAPETALILGNIFSYIVSFKEKTVLVLSDKREIAKGAYEFIFSTKRPIKFLPGQYLEWTLPNTGLDSRGNRRFFTIASSPTEKNIHLGVRFYPNPSKFKTKLLSLSKGDKLTVGQLSGDFVLPEDTSRKLVFIAGGIGITPFRSMIKFLLDNNQRRDVVFIVINKTPEEIPYKDLLNEAEKKVGIKIVHVLTELKTMSKDLQAEIGHLTDDMIRKHISDYNDRTFYISGSNAVVNSCKKILAEVGVKASKIVTDYFPGF
jgi:ferredoxin-NADP reductase